MKVLVTGGAGFIGSHVAEFYCKSGDEVIILDNLSRAKVLGKNTGDVAYNWNYLKKNYPQIKLINGDVRNFEEIKAAAKGVNTVFHIAAQVAVTTSLTDPRLDFETNTIGTFNALEVARLNNASVIFTSTNKVYGENVNKVPVGEGEKRYLFADHKYKNGISEEFSTDLCGHSPYGCSKLAADIFVQDYAYTYGLKTGVFRMSCIYGLRQFGVEDQGWVAWFIIASLLNKPITIYGDGKQVRDILYVDDLVKAFNAFLNSNLKHEVFNMGGGANNVLSLIELLEYLEKSIGKQSSIQYSDWRSNDQKVYVSDISKAKQKLNWEPKVTVKEGLDNLILFFKSHFESSA